MDYLYYTLIGLMILSFIAIYFFTKKNRKLKRWQNAFKMKIPLLPTKHLFVSNKGVTIYFESNYSDKELKAEAVDKGLDELFNDVKIYEENKGVSFPNYRKHSDYVVIFIDDVYKDSFGNNSMKVYTNEYIGTDFDKVDEDEQHFVLAAERVIGIEELIQINPPVMVLPQTNDYAYIQEAVGNGGEHIVALNDIEFYQATRFHGSMGHKFFRHLLNK